jgi:hypothetical protein
MNDSLCYIRVSYPSLTFIFWQANTRFSTRTQSEGECKCSIAVFVSSVLAAPTDC